MGSRDIHHCDQCAHKTTRKGNLERHLRTVHKRDVNIDSRHRLLERGPTSAPYLNESFNFNVEQQQPPRLRSMERTETTPEKMMESILDVSKWAVQIKRNMAALSNGAGGTQSPEDKVIQEFLKENLNAFAKECMPPEFQQRWADSVNTRSDSPPGTQSGTLQQSNKLTDSHSRTTIAENKLDERQKANVGNNNDGFPLGHILSRSAERTIAADDKTDEGVDSLIAMKSPSSGGPKLDQE